MLTMSPFVTVALSAGEVSETVGGWLAGKLLSQVKLSPSLSSLLLPSEQVVLPQVIPLRLVPTLSSAPSRFAFRRSALFRDTYQSVVKLRSAPRKSVFRMSPLIAEPEKLAFCRLEPSKV